MRVQTYDFAFYASKQSREFKRMFGHLPQAVQIGFQQIQDIEPTIGCEWVMDDLAVEAIHLMSNAHHGKFRKYGVDRYQGPLVREIHQIGMANRAYNMGKYTSYLRKNGLAREFAVLPSLTHDNPEDELDWELKNNNFELSQIDAFIEKKIEENVALLSGHPGQAILERCLRYATDNPSLHGAKRILAQRDKSFLIKKAGNGQLYYETKIGVDEQVVRMLDKLNQVLGDAYVVRQGRMTPERAEQQLKKAGIKNYVMLFSFMPGSFRREYLQAEDILAKHALLAQPTQDDKWVIDTPLPDAVWLQRQPRRVFFQKRATPIYQQAKLACA